MLVLCVYTRDTIPERVRYLISGVNAYFQCHAELIFATEWLVPD